MLKHGDSAKANHTKPHIHYYLQLKMTFITKFLTIKSLVARYIKVRIYRTKQQFNANLYDRK